MATIMQVPPPNLVIGVNGLGYFPEESPTVFAHNDCDMGFTDGRFADSQQVQQ